jgi:hypothetical protein
MKGINVPTKILQHCSYRHHSLKRPISWLPKLPSLWLLRKRASSLGVIFGAILATASSFTLAIVVRASIGTWRHSRFTSSRSIERGSMKFSSLICFSVLFGSLRKNLIMHRTAISLTETAICEQTTAEALASTVS